MKIITIKISLLTVLLSFTQISDARTVNTLSVSGIEKRSTMEGITELWHNFEKANYLHSTLKATPKKLYVHYDAFSTDYQQSDILIGYNVRDLKRYKHSKTIDLSQFTQVLAKGHYTAKQLSDAWQTFDYRKQIKAVLEVHTVATLNNKEQIALYVLYK